MFDPNDVLSSGTLYFVPANAYVDVRGPWPILVIGLQTFELQGLTRAVTTEQAFELVSEAGWFDAPTVYERL